MKCTLYIFIAICLAGLTAGISSADEQGDGAGYSETNVSLENKDSAIEVPPGMELRMMGGLKMIVPEGARVRKKNSIFIMEEADEYAARNIYEMKGRLRGLESRQMDLEKELTGLKEAVAKLQEKPKDQQLP